MKDSMDPAARMVHWISGKWTSHAIHAAATLGIADHLAAGPLASDELARRTGAHAPSLYRLLRALASHGIFRECESGMFETTPLGVLLETGRMRAACLMIHSEWHDRAWGRLLDSVRTGVSGFELSYGEPLFSWLNEHPSDAEVFNATMTSGRQYRDRGVADAYDFGAAASIVDVGGGEGALLISILEKHPRLRGTLVDLARAVASAEPAIARAGLAGRCLAEIGDFFASVPAGADLYLLAHVLHDWDDARCRDILRVCRTSMHDDAHLLLVETPMSGANEADRLKWLDLEMLVLTTGGRERTRDEYAALLDDTGLTLDDVVPTTGSRSVLVASVRRGDRAS